MEPVEIHPGIGAGKVRLGVSPSLVRSFLGEPDEVDGSEWSYDKAGIAVTFENEKAVSIDAFAEVVTVDGRTIEGEDRTAVADLLDEIGWGQPRIECDDDGETEFWNYANGVTVTFRGEAIDNITIEARRTGASPVRTAEAAVLHGKDYRRRRAAFWAVFFAALSTFGFVIAAKKNRYNAEIRTWPVARATVTRMAADATDEQTRNSVYYSYIIGSETREGMDRHVSEAYKPGDVVRIRYAPDRNESYIEDEIRDASPMFTFGVLAAVASLGFIARLVYVIRAMRAARQRGPQATPARG